jgi:DNA uptake protein ComE-like DNA-binding protein
MYRSLNPDQATVKEMLKKLKGIGIDANELIEYRMENCQEGDWSMEEVPLRDTGIGN